MQHDADAAENNNNGYNPNDPYSYSYTYTIDQQGNYHYDWKGNWSPQQAQQGNNSNYSNANQSTQSYNSYNNYNNYRTNNQTQSYNSNNGGGLGANYSTSDRNVKVTTQSAPTQNLQAMHQLHSQVKHLQVQTYTLQVNVLTMFMTKLAAKSAQLGATLTTGLTQQHHQVTL